MIKTIIISLLTFTIFSCTDINHLENSLAKIETLKQENDSLKSIVAEINEKFVFDSIAIRDIKSPKNSYNLNSEMEGEIVFVGYNRNEKSRVVKFDSVTYENGRILHNPDTLKLKKGGYKYRKKLTEKLNLFHVELRTENEYGKLFRIVYSTAIRTDKN